MTADVPRSVPAVVITGPSRTGCSTTPADTPPAAQRAVVRCAGRGTPTPSRSRPGATATDPRGSGQLGVSQHPLHVRQRHLRIPGPDTRPTAADHEGTSSPPPGRWPGEHRISGVIGQAPKRGTQRPPQRLIPASRNQIGHLQLVKAQPHEPVRGGGQLLQCPRSLTHQRDQPQARERYARGELTPTNTPSCCTPWDCEHMRPLSRRCPRCNSADRP